MKKFSFLALLALCLYSCQNESVTENDSDLNTPPNLNLVDGVTTSERLALKAGEPGTRENPIEISPSTFITYVTYSLNECKFGTKTYARYFKGKFYFDPLAGVTFGYTPNILKGDCLVSDNSGVQGTDSFKFQTYYKIFGEVVQASHPNGGELGVGFWYKEVPGTDKIQKVQFDVDKVYKIEEPIDFPFKRNIDCSKLREFNYKAKYSQDELVVDVASKAVYTIWDPVDNRKTYVGQCSDASVISVIPVEPICKNVPSWKRGVQYKVGDRVVFFKTLYIREVYGWRKIGSCN